LEKQKTQKYFMATAPATPTPSVTLITSIFGPIDLPKKVPAQSIPFKHFHYGDSDAEITPGRNNREKALYWKINGHRYTDTDIVIYVDGKIQILAYDFLQQCIDGLGENDFAMLRHGERDCIYKEIDHIEAKVKAGDPYHVARYKDKPIRAQVEAYRQDGYPSGAGLGDCCIFIYRRFSWVMMMLNDWWDDVYINNAFDQTAVRYHAWKHGIKIIPLAFKPASFKHVRHQNNRI
jgi:hypothetical protein